MLTHPYSRRPSELKTKNGETRFDNRNAFKSLVKMRRYLKYQHKTLYYILSLFGWRGVIIFCRPEASTRSGLWSVSKVSNCLDRSRVALVGFVWEKRRTPKCLLRMARKWRRRWRAECRSVADPNAPFACGRNEPFDRSSVDRRNPVILWDF